MGKQLKCGHCDEPSGVYALCVRCERFHLSANGSKWPVSLGLAIARFCHRARVEALVDRATEAHYLTVDARGALGLLPETEHTRRAHARRNMQRGYADHADALAELRELAIEGGARG